MKQTIKNNKVEWLLLIIYLVILITIHVRLNQYAFDDAYIHFRVARNLIEMGVPYFNLQDSLKVSTSSGWVIFLAITYALLKTMHLENNLPVFIGIINAIITMGVVIVFSRLVEVLQNKSLKLFQKITLQIIILALLLPSSIGLMETPFALLIAGLALYLICLSKPLGFTFLGFAVCLRLELVILLALLFVFVVLKNKMHIQKVVGYSFLGVAPFVSFDLFFYATIIPHSIIAKPQLYSITSASALADILFSSLPNISLPPFVNAVSLITLIVVVCWVMIRAIANGLTIDYSVLLYCLGVFILCVYIFGHSLLFSWYIPLYMLPITLSLISYLLKYPDNKILSILFTFLFFVSFVSISTTIYSSYYKPNYFVLFESGSRVKMYLSVGQIIKEDYPNANLLTSEIGGLGYSFTGKIFDAGGLASSDSLSFHPMNVPKERSSGNVGAIPPAYVRLVNPEIIISYDVFAEALLRDEVATHYNIISLPAYLPEDAKYSQSKTIWGSKYIRIYILKTLPVSRRICVLAMDLNETLNKVCSEKALVQVTQASR